MRFSSHLTLNVVVFLVALLVPQTHVSGQEATALFAHVPEAGADLLKATSEALEGFRADPTSAEVSIVRINLDLPRTARSLLFNLAADTALAPGIGATLLTERVDERAAQDYSWFGASDDGRSDAILVVQNGSMAGTLHHDGELYRIRPLGDDLHAVIRVDPAAWPEEHPPEYENLRVERPREPRRPRQEAGGTVPDSPESDQPDQKSADTCSTATVLVAYTPAAQSQAGNVQALIQLAIDETNQSYSRSGVAPRLKLVHTYRTSYTEASSMVTDLNRFRVKGDGVMDEVHGRRDQYRADVAILITKNGNYCGYASAIRASSSSAFAVVAQNCATGYYSFGHEIGHLQGARHNPEADPSTSPFPYGHGYYYQPGRWRTVMSYNCPSGCTRQKNWSNPSVTFGGVATGTAATHHNARVLNTTACTMANFRQSVIGGWSRWVNGFGYNAGGWRVNRHPRMMADVNGDGKADVVGFGNAGVYVSLSTGSGFSSPKRWVGSYGFNAGGWRINRHPRMMADVNGDGKADVVGFGNAGVYVSLSTGSGFSSPKRWVGSYGFNAGGWRVNRHPRMMADVNGDGKADVVGFGNAGAYVSLSTGSTFSSPKRWVGSYGYNAGGWRIGRHPRMMADVNGDDKADVIGFGNAGVYVSLSTGSGFSSPSRWVNSYGYSAGGWRVNRHPRMMADVNDDGKADVVGFANAGVYVSRSTGSGFSSPNRWVNTYGFNAGGWRVNRHPRMMADVTNDGKADVVGFGNAGAYVSRSTGNGLTSAQLWVSTYGYSAGGWRVSRHPRMMADVDGDGRADVVGFGNAGVYVSRSTGSSFK